VLVDNRISVVVTVDRVLLEELPANERDGMLERLSRELTQAGTPTTVADLKERLRDERFSPYTPIPVAQDVPEHLKIMLEERGDEFPAVSVERTAVRRYPYGQIGAHILGYVGRISEEEYDERRDEQDKPYQLGDHIGKAGVERSYEADLRGVPGVRHIEVDAEGDPVRVIEGRSNAPVPGDDVVLTLDINLQALSEQTLAQGLDQARDRRVRQGEEPHKGTKGAVVVQDPSNGEILAMASFPAFPDPSEFVNGISSERWAQLNDPASHYPLNNWALQGEWAPGSTFKLFTGYASMMAGLRAPETTINDRGFYDVPDCSGRCRFFNAGSDPKGVVDMRKALTVSSDVFFYDIGAQFWIQRGRLGSPNALQDLVKRFGLGAPTGIAIPGERDGVIPTPEQRKQFCEEVECIDSGWYTGDNVNIAIGQGDLVVTPLQLANGYASVANGGTLRTPIVVKEVRRGTAEQDDEPEVVRKVESSVVHQIEMPPPVRQALLDGLVGVTQRDGGTASGVFGGFPHDAFPVAAKTGTAQVRGKADTAVFVAFGPAPLPNRLVSVFLEESGFGGVAAAPVARRLFDVFAGVAPMPQAPAGGDFDPQVAGVLQTGGEVLD
jgi:penicillin-binding protein 2